MTTTVQRELPEYRVDLCNPPRHRHALVIPVINEGDRIRQQLRLIHAGNYPVDVILVDGGSTDGSLAHSYLRDVGVAALLTKVGPGKLSAQLRHYYNRHLDPYDNPDTKDIKALQAIEEAQKAFDIRLNEGFERALKELEQLGYPGVTDPKLNISTRLRPVEGLNHESAVRYIVQMTDGPDTTNLHLPEDSNGLGYQNLVSMVFRLMSYRDAWMLVGKAEIKTRSTTPFRSPAPISRTGSRQWVVKN